MGANCRVACLLTSLLAVVAVAMAVDCELPYLPVIDRCLVIEPFYEGTLAEMEYECRRYGGSMIEIHEPNEFRTLIQYLKNEGLDQHSYWLAARKDYNSTRYYWSNTNTDMIMGTPFWAIDEGIYSDDPYYQDPYLPTVQEMGVVMNWERKLLLSDKDPEDFSAGTICEQTPTN